VTEEPLRCPECHAALPERADRCPSCGRPVAASGPAPAAKAARPGPAEAAPGDLERWLARLRQWREAADCLGVEVPGVPRWVEARARGEPSERWNDVVQRLEQSAADIVADALAGWEGTMDQRLDRLESYHIEVQLERSQVLDALDAVAKGEAARMVASLRQVDRVVSLKERHLDQARGEIDALAALLRDMRALELPVPQEPAKIAEELEEELRLGRLASLKQRLRSIRADADRIIAERLPSFVTRYGSFLAEQRQAGSPIEPEAAELARSARALSRGHPDEAVRRLRALADSHPAPKGPSEAGAPA
jgi:hypothetical protein